MDNGHPEGNQYQFVTSPSGYYLGRDTHVRHYDREMKNPQRLLNWYAREWNPTSGPGLG